MKTAEIEDLRDIAMATNFWPKIAITGFVRKLVRKKICTQCVKATVTKRWCVVCVIVTDGFIYSHPIGGSTHPLKDSTPP